jgi:hypothetical protein
VEHERERQRHRNADRADRYDAEHRALRARWSLVVEDGGVRCPRCGHLIRPTADWHLDHLSLLDRQFAADEFGMVVGKRHPSHDVCNEGARSNVARRS